MSVETCGSEKSQVPPASQAYPSRHCVIWSADVGRFTSAMVLRFILRSFESYSGGKPDRLCNPTDEGGQPQGSRNVRERFATGPGRDWSSFARRSSSGEHSVEIVQRNSVPSSPSSLCAPLSVRIVLQRRLRTPFIQIAAPSQIQIGLVGRPFVQRNTCCPSYSGGKPDRLCNPTDEGGQPQGSRNVRERFATGPGRDWNSFARRSSSGEHSLLK